MLASFVQLLMHCSVDAETLMVQPVLALVVAWSAVAHFERALLEKIGHESFVVVAVVGFVDLLELQVEPMNSSYMAPTY